MKLFSLPDPGLNHLVSEFTADWETIARRYRLSLSSTQIGRQQKLVEDWKGRLEGIPFDQLSQEAKVDLVLLINHLQEREGDLKRRREEAARLAPSLPFAEIICRLEREKADLSPLNPRAASEELDLLAKAIKDSPEPTEDAVGLAWTEELSESINRWSDFYSGYDPEVDWWIREPLARVKDELKGLKGRQKEAEKSSESIPAAP